MCLNRSDELGGQYADRDYHNMTAGISNYTEEKTKPLLQQYELESYAQQAVTDVVTVSPSSGVAYNTASTGTCITYAQLQPL